MRNILKNKKTLFLIISIIVIILLCIIVFLKYEVNIVKKNIPYIEDKKNEL